VENEMERCLWAQRGMTDRSKTDETRHISQINTESEL
jgi:hypothetical protein